MLYCSIDIETTGLHPLHCDLIEFAAILDDTNFPNRPIKDLPKFHRYVYNDNDVYRGGAMVLAWHSNIFNRIYEIVSGKTSEYKGCKIQDLGKEFLEFLTSNGCSGKLTPAGKNFSSFDLSFLLNVPDFQNFVGLERADGPKTSVSLAKRCIDPAVLYYKNTDKLLPDTKACLQRAGINTDSSHTALEDAEIVVQLVRTGFTLTGLTE